MAKITEDRILQAAKVAHEANRAYCETIGDFSQLTWDNSPLWQRDSAIKGIRFHIKTPNADPSASHEAWLSHKRSEGWTYGSIKDPVRKEHPCMVNFYSLPPEQQMKDLLFGNVAKTFIDS